MKKGFFITFEGCEGCGKSTQSKMLAKYLRKKGYTVALTREPGGTKTSKAIRNFILHTRHKISPLAELMLFEADRAQHVRELIIPKLGEGCIVICDRYADATLAYQGYARGLDINTIKTLNKIATDNLKPDITFLLDYDVQAGLKKAKEVSKGFDRMESEKVVFHKKVKSGYLKIAESSPKRFRVIKTQRDKKQTQSLIRKEIEKALSRHGI